MKINKKELKEDMLILLNKHDIYIKEENGLTFSTLDNKDKILIINIF